MNIAAPAIDDSPYLPVSSPRRYTSGPPLVPCVSRLLDSSSSQFTSCGTSFGSHLQLGHPLRYSRGFESKSAGVDSFVQGLAHHRESTNLLLELAMLPVEPMVPLYFCQWGPVVELS